MQSIKRLCMLVVAVIAVLSLVSAASAPAATTVLCKVNVAPCPSTPVNQRWEGIGFEMKATNFRLLTFGPTGEVLCKAATVNGTLGAFGAPQKVTVSALSFATCKFGATACEVIEAIPGVLDLLRTKVNLGESTFLNTEILVNCAEKIHCEFSLEGTLHLQGSESAEKAAVISTTGTVLTPMAGEICPSKTTLTVSFEVLLPFPAFVSA